MNYAFPVINTINDVLPAIAGRDEFVVAERDFGTVINYLVAMPDTFKMEGPDDVMGAIRRECRGLIFDLEGRIMSRPFHKFFNVNEKEETQAHMLDLSRPHVIMEKMDGSMIRPIFVDGYLRLATKMGVTEVAMQAEAWLAAQDPVLKQWMAIMMVQGITPIFEWVSPFNQIVLAYETADLVLLALRNNITGEYLDVGDPKDDKLWTVVPQYGSVAGSLADYIARQRGAEGREGDIIRFADGHMIKVKNDWYVQIHKTKDIVRVDRNIIELVLNETIDDTRAMLDPSDLVRVDEVEAGFWAAFENAEGRLLGLEMLARTIYGADKKRIALEMVPNLINKQDGGFIFKLIDGYAIRDLLLDHCKKNIGSTPKYEALMEWMKA
jgi:RNA ligase